MLRCFHVLLALSLITYQPAQAAVKPDAQIACYPAKEMVGALIMNGFAPVADLEVGGLPGMIFSRDDTTDYLVFVLKDDLMCEVGSGKAFHLIKRRKA